MVEVVAPTTSFPRLIMFMTLARRVVVLRLMAKAMARLREQTSIYTERKIDKYCVDIGPGRGN
jgi:hypothetical protein